MDPNLKKTLRSISLEIRRLLEGRYDEHGNWQGGDLERRLNELGVWRDRNAKPVEELPHLSAEDRTARRLVDAYLRLRDEAGVGRAAAVSEFVRESAYCWANRLFALRCMEARGVIDDEVILQKEAYGGRSLVHHRFAKKHPSACDGDDDGLLIVLFAEFEQRAKDLPLLFDPKSPAVALRPSIAALKRTIALLSGRDTARGQEPATDALFTAPDAFGWAYQYYQDDEKKRVDNWLKTKNGYKCQGADIIPKTALYTEPYMVKCLIQNSLGALWMAMYPDSKLCEAWEYYVKTPSRTPVMPKPVCEITFLDPALGSGHFHLEAFDLFYAMYEEEGARSLELGAVTPPLTPRQICAAILNRNLFGIDIDECAVQIATAALWMRAKEKAPDLESGDLTTFGEHLQATNIRLPKERNHLELFLQKHPEDEQLRPALELVFKRLEHADELGSLLQIEEPVDLELRRLKSKADAANTTLQVQPDMFRTTAMQSALPIGVETYEEWKAGTLDRLKAHFEQESEASDSVRAFFGASARKGLALFGLLARRYEIVAANPPYLGTKKQGEVLKGEIKASYADAQYDLYTAFISRAQSLLQPAGHAALVTRSSWQHQKWYMKMRARLLSEECIDLVVSLGTNAFSDFGGDVVDVSLLCLVAAKNDVVRTATVASSENKAEALRAVCRNERIQLRKAAIFQDIPGKVISTSLDEGLLGAFSLQPLSTYAKVTDSVVVVSRYLRFHWEVPVGTARWLAYSKGGGFGKWRGSEHYVLDWQESGARLTSYVLGRYPPSKFRLIVKAEDTIGKQGLTWTTFASSAFGVRVLSEPYIVSSKGPGIYPISVSTEALVALLNSRVSAFLLRIISPGQEFGYKYVEQLPVPNLDDATGVQLSQIGRFCFQAKTVLCESNLLERCFRPVSLEIREHRTIREANAKRHTIGLRVAAALLTAEALIESLAAKAYGLSLKELARVYENTGNPPGLAPYIGSIPPPVPSIEGVVDLSTFGVHTLADIPMVVGGGAQLATDSLAGNFQTAAPISDSESDDLDEITEEAEASEDEAISNVPIPEETDLARISKNLWINPVSVAAAIETAMTEGGHRIPTEEKRLTEDRLTVLVLRMFGHCWPRQMEAGDLLSDSDGVIPISPGSSEATLASRVREQLDGEFPGGNIGALDREFEEIVGVSLEQWLAGPFFERHSKQFRKRPIAWQVESDVRGQQLEGRKRKRGKVATPVFACLIYYHKLHAGLLPKMRTHYIGVLQGGYETELRTLEKLANPTPDQQGRKLQLDQWIEEMKAFDLKLEQVALTGFGPAALRAALRQYAIDDALLNLTACWLRKLEEAISGDTLKEWQNVAADTKLHADLPMWIGEAFRRLDYFCAAVVPKPPVQETFVNDPTSENLAPLVCVGPTKTVIQVLNLACKRWWQKFDETVLAPLKEQLKRAREEQKRVKEELEFEEVKRDFRRQKELAVRKDELKIQIKSLHDDIDEKTDKGKELRSHIESWTYPDVVTWEDWLCKQPLFDLVASLDGKRKPPTTIADFIAQESVYAPDINDGVRVNIAPVQKAGLLHAEVLDAKDADKAIADRAEWRADERRWVREGKLPQPGWWETTKNRI